ncbi:MAG: tail fiber domain-containing protein [Saprospiraceae bacterium]|nr:tail fiber domain-containing protein [Saprospiraceae bacterium]
MTTNKEFKHNMVQRVFASLLFLFVCGISIAQVPQSFMVQGLAQDADGIPLINEEVTLEILLDGTALDHESVVTTSSAGVFQVEVSGVDLLDLLQTGSAFLEVFVNDIALTTPLLSVPYALVAEQVVNDQFEDDDADSTNELQVLSFVDGMLQISGGNEISIPTGNTDADADPTNELQTLAINNGVLSISDGNEVTLPTGDGGVDDDADPTNELQQLKLDGTTLSIVPPGAGQDAVNLPTGDGGGTSLWSENGQDIFYNTGNVGIGTSDPETALHVDGDLSVGNGNTRQVTMSSNGSKGELKVFDSDNDVIAEIKANGSFNDPQGEFGYMELFGPSGGTNIILGFIGPQNEQDRGGIGIYNESNQAWWMSTGASGDQDLSLYYFNGNNLNRLGEFSRSTGQYSVLSDRRVKENISSLSNVLTGIKALRPVTYNYIHDAEKRKDIGFVAQDVEEEFPALVSRIDERMGLNYAGFSVLAIKAIQEQQTIIENQQETIANLLKRVEALEEKTE